MAHHWVGGTDTWNGTAGTKWSATSGGAGGLAEPTSTDDVFFDGNSGTVTITLGAISRVCKSINFTGFTGTFAMGIFSLSVSGDITFDNAGMTITGTHLLGLAINATSTITTNGFQVPVTISSFGTITLADNLTFTGAGSLRATSSLTLNGNNVYVSGSGNCHVTNNGSVLSGTSVIHMTGNGGSIGSSSTGISVRIESTIVINTAGTISFALGFSSTFRVGGNGSFTWTAGTISNANTSGVIFNITTGSTYTINTGGNTLANFTISSGSTLVLTLNGLLTVSETITLPNATLTFTGTHGFTTNNLVTTTLTASRNYIFTSGYTYTINNDLTSIAGNLNSRRPTFKSSSGGSQAILTLGTSATQNISFVNATDIDSSAGQTINSYKGVLSNTLNWYTTNGDFLALAYP